MDWLIGLIEDPSKYWPAIVLLLAATMYKFAGGEQWIKERRAKKEMTGVVEQALRDDGKGDIDAIKGVVLSRSYLAVMEERASELYAQKQIAQALQLTVDRLRRENARLQREVREHGERINTITDQQSVLGSDFVEIRSILQDLGAKMEEYTSTMREFQTWLSRRRATNGTETP